MGGSTGHPPVMDAGDVRPDQPPVMDAGDVRPDQPDGQLLQEDQRAVHPLRRNVVPVSVLGPPCYICLAKTQLLLNQAVLVPCLLRLRLVASPPPAHNPWHGPWHGPWLPERAVSNHTHRNTVSYTGNNRTHMVRCPSAPR